MTNMDPDRPVLAWHNKLLCISAGNSWLRLATQHGNETLATCRDRSELEALAAVLYRGVTAVRHEGPMPQQGFCLGGARLRLTEGRPVFTLLAGGGAWPLEHEIAEGLQCWLNQVTGGSLDIGRIDGLISSHVNDTGGCLHVNLLTSGEFPIDFELDYDVAAEFSTKLLNAAASPVHYFNLRSRDGGTISFGQGLHGARIQVQGNILPLALTSQVALARRVATLLRTE